MKFVSRSAWGARYGRGGTNITPSRGGVTVHYEGGGRLTGGPHSQCDDRVRNIERYHVQHNGWNGIAYTALVCEHGYVFEGRGLGRRTAANGTNAGNQSWYAVCALIGDKDPLSAELLRGIRDAIDWCRKSGGAGPKVNGHRDHLATSCPGDELYAWVRAGMPADIEEDDMPSPKDLWEWDGVPAPRSASTYKTNPTWKPASHLTDINERVRALQATAAATQAALGELSRAVAELAADRGQQVDADALVARIAEQIERVTVRLDVQTGDGE